MRRSEGGRIDPSGIVEFESIYNDPVSEWLEYVSCLLVSSSAVTGWHMEAGGVQVQQVSAFLVRPEILSQLKG